MVRFFLVVILVGWVSVCNSQNLNNSIRNYTAIDGLPQSQVQAIVEDENGYLWLATQGGGLAMFDGRQFRVYTTLDGLLSNFVTGLSIDHYNNLWILHPRGLTKFDGLNFKKFHFPGWTHPAKNYRSLFNLGESIYVLSEEGLTKIKNDSTYYWDKPIAGGKSVMLTFQTADGELCFYLETGEILVYTDDKEYTFQVEEEIVNIFRHGREQWIQSKSGIFNLNIKEQKIEKRPFRLAHFVRLYDEKNDVYWTRDRENLYREKIVGDKIETDTILKDVSIVQVLPDAEGNVWFASDGNGLYKYYFQDFDQCTSDHLKGVMAIHVDRTGTNWIGTMSKGLWSIKKGKVKAYHHDNPYKNMIHDIAESPDGTLWVATAFGLAKLNRNTEEFDWILKDEASPIRNVRCISFDEKGTMWLGTGDGVIQFNGETYRQYTSTDGLKADMVLVTSYLPKTRTLFVGNEFGLNTIREGKVSTIAIPELDNTIIFGLHPYRDSLMLVGTGGSGVLIFDPTSYKRKLITRYDGLTSDFIYFVVPDKENKIWIGTEKGITRLELNNDWEITENLHYDEANGLTGIETNQGAYYLSNDHKYFGLVDGLYEFNDIQDLEAKSFDLHLTDVKIFYGDHSARDYSENLAGFFKIPVHPILPSDKNHITFHFNRVDKRYPKSVRFRYLLENFDKTWSQPAATTQVTYSNLPPGNYTFRVMATNHLGSWAEDKILYTFTVKAPFYQTASFITGVIIFIAGSITLLMYRRVRQRVRKVIETERIRMREQESLRKEIARDFHDEIGNQLTRIINYVSLLKLNVDGGNGSNKKGNGQHGHSHQDLYSKVEESAKVLYTGTRDFIWSIDPINDELSNLFVHIRDFGEKLFEEKEINFRAYDEVKEPIKLPQGFSREANLIFKEAMTNAFKYSKAQNVKFTLRRIENRFEMAFEDDGVGFSTYQVEKSNGLRNIQERTNRLGAVLRIHSDINMGTRITLDFKPTKTLKYGNAI